MKIDTKKYEGYLWYSDQNKPLLLPDTSINEIQLTDGDNPFVIEGLLWDQQNMTSISIRYIDGKYMIKEIKVKKDELDNNNSEHATYTEYIAHRLEGISKLKFIRYWEPQSDPECEGMDVLQQTNIAFVGFKYQKEE